MKLSSLTRARRMSWNIFEAPLYTGPKQVIAKLRVGIKHIVLGLYTNPSSLVYILNSGGYVRVIYGWNQTFFGFEMPTSAFAALLLDRSIMHNVTGHMNRRIQAIIHSGTVNVKRLSREEAKLFLGWDFDT